MLRELKSTLESMGLTVTISTFNSRNDLITAAKDQKVHLIADTWSIEEAQMLSNRFSSDALGNVFGLKDEDLDASIEEAEKLLDQTAAIALYQDIINTVAELQIVVPLCQNQTAIIYNTDRLESAGIPADMTCYWDWSDAIETLTLS